MGTAEARGKSSPGRRTCGAEQGTITQRGTGPDFTRRPMCYLSSFFPSSRPQLPPGIPDCRRSSPPRPAESTPDALLPLASAAEDLPQGSPASHQLELVTALRRVTPPGQGMPRLLLSARDACAHAVMRPEAVAASSLLVRGGVGGAGDPAKERAADEAAFGLGFLQELEADLQKECGALRRQGAQFACAKGIVAARSGSRVMRGCGGGARGLLPPLPVRRHVL